MNENKQSIQFASSDIVGREITTLRLVLCGFLCSLQYFVLFKRAYFSTVILKPVDCLFLHLLPFSAEIKSLLFTVFLLIILIFTEIMGKSNVSPGIL